jgi:hypothetical protein
MLSKSIQAVNIKGVRKAKIFFISRLLYFDDAKVKPSLSLQSKFSVFGRLSPFFGKTLAIIPSNGHHFLLLGRAPSRRLTCCAGGSFGVGVLQARCSLGPAARVSGFAGPFGHLTLAIIYQ